LEADDLVAAHLELNPALLAAETAVRLDEFFRRMARFIPPAAGRHVVQVRAVAVNQCFDRQRSVSHVDPLSFSVAPMRWPCVCRPDKAVASARPGRAPNNQSPTAPAPLSNPPRASARRNALRTGRTARLRPCRLPRDKTSRQAAPGVERCGRIF